MAITDYTDDIDLGAITLMAESTMKQPAPMLRWRGGVLQKKWQVMTLRLGVVQSAEEEWRDVPVAID